MYILVRGKWFKGCKKGVSTLNIKLARRYATWQKANEACKGTSWKFCHEDEAEADTKNKGE